MKHDIYESHRGYGTKLLPFINRRDYVVGDIAFVPHWHENIEILFCTEGEGLVLLNGIPYEFKPGYTVIANKNTIHCILTETIVKYECLIVFDSFLQENGIDTEARSLKCQINSPDIGKLINASLESFSKNASEPIKTRLAVLTLISRLYDEFEKESAATFDESLSSVKSALEFIQKNFSEKISLEDTANAAHLSKYYFTKKFKEITGKCFSEFLAIVRCDHAANMLEEGKTINEACFASGFSDPAYFSRVFKKVKGVPPSRIKTEN